MKYKIPQDRLDKIIFKYLDINLKGLEQRKPKHYEGIIFAYPDEEFGMSTKAYQAALQQPKKDRVKALAQAFRQIGGAAVAGGFDGIKSLELASVEANRKAICGTVDPSSPEGMAIRTEWLPFFKAIQPGITEAVKGSASTPTGYGKLLIEIAVGLEAVK